MGKEMGHYGREGYAMTTSGPDIGRTRLDERYVRRMPFGSWTMIMISLTEAFVGRLRMGPGDLVGKANTGELWW